MCCNAFWNIRGGKRDRIGVFSEWEAQWNHQWTTLLGIRSDRVKSNTGPVQGYSSSSYQTDADAFNALNRSREDYHFDLTALSRFTPDDMQSYEFGFARKTRSPSLYERYPWSRFPMAALMNNFVGDGNGYIGNPDLKPEVAYTISASGDWHDANQEKWQVKTTAYLTYVENYIDATRLPGYNRGSNAATTIRPRTTQKPKPSCCTFSLCTPGKVNSPRAKSFILPYVCRSGKAAYMYLCHR